MKKIAFIGGGNLASSLIHGLLEQGCEADSLSVFDTAPERLELLGRRYAGIRICSTAPDIGGGSDAVLLCVKPNDARDACREACELLRDTDAAFISVVAGVKLAVLARWLNVSSLGSGVAVLRCMPNLAVAVGQGMSVLCAGDVLASADHGRLAEHIFKAVGAVEWVEDEKLMDLVTALSGSGPAYFFYVMDALEQAAAELGLQGGLARRLVSQTAFGAAAFAQKGEEPPAQLCTKVASKGGTTEAAIAVFEQHKLKLIFKRALEAAARRSETITKEVG